jgi:hypothetical protein
MIAGTAAILILIVLSDLHVYWARGGKAGKGAAIPTLNERPALKPTALTTIMVAVVLLAMAAVLAFRIGWLDLPAVPGLSSFVRVCAWLIAVAFALRAVGDFRYVGFFKKIRESRFARLDTFAYSPLCACLAVLVGLAAQA